MMECSSTPIDAWNRQIKVTKAYRDSGSTLTAGSEVSVSAYDGMGRRVSRQVKNSADWNATYHSYHHGQNEIETRNGSSQVLRQMVWGAMYSDELLQIGWNPHPDTNV
jgi:hypothetical protein